MSDPTRLKTVLVLAQGGRNVTQLSEDLTVRTSGLSHHLSLLCHARLAEMHRDGRRNYWRLTYEGRRLAALIVQIFR
jgi:DNA-binding transcriptional ArsR family regulator